MDLIGPFVPGLNNIRYILTMVDHCPGWDEAYPIPDKRKRHHKLKVMLAKAVETLLQTRKSLYVGPTTFTSLFYLHYKL